MHLQVVKKRKARRGNRAGLLLPLFCSWLVLRGLRENRRKIGPDASLEAVQRREGCCERGAGLQAPEAAYIAALRFAFRRFFALRGAAAALRFAALRFAGFFAALRFVALRFTAMVYLRIKVREFAYMSIC
ncbi:MAG: hypothetical protein HXY23_01700 [Parvularculaceae bacterium]|nr:hypothetical protein [Parvularculaceae bacterium]